MMAIVYILVLTLGIGGVISPFSLQGSGIDPPVREGGNICGVTITRQEVAVDGVLVRVTNIGLNEEFGRQISECPPVPEVSGGGKPECYRFDNLPAGPYVLIFSKDGYITRHVIVKVTKGEDIYIVGWMTSL